MSAFTPSPSKLIHRATHAPRLFPRVPTTKHKMKSHRLISTTHPTPKTNKFSSGCITNNAGVEDSNTLPHLKTNLLQQLKGMSMNQQGDFWSTSSKKSNIEALVGLLESQNPTPDPTLNLEQVGGCWKLVYRTITISGSKRTKLGLRDFIALGDFFQTIDIEKNKAVNMIEFNARGLALLNGKLRIEASFKIASKSRVDISYDSSTITPDQLMNVFRKNYDLLLGIFNPEGWLEITYVDETMRIGRDDKGNLFILERSEADKSIC